MGKSRYIKDDKGVTMSVTTSTLGLEKPLLNENYNIDVHNRNMDKIDEDLTPIDDSYIIELFQHDGDISRPRDYYTKEESDLKYATKENVENIDLSNLATKEEVNQALNKANEAFQRGDNVKTQLVDKLISEGLDVSTNNTFEELIGNIALGKKWAKGEDALVYSSGGVFRSYSQTISNLDFVPSLVFCYCEHLFGDTSANYLKGAVTSNLGYLSMYTANSSASVTISNNSFTFDISTQGTVGSLSFTWYAFE